MSMGGTSYRRCTKQCTGHYWGSSIQPVQTLPVLKIRCSEMLREPKAQKWLQRALSLQKGTQKPAWEASLPKSFVWARTTQTVLMRSSPVHPCHQIRKLNNSTGAHTRPGETITSASVYLMPRQQLCNDRNKTSYSWGTGLPADKGFFLWLLFEVFNMKFLL